MLEEKIISIHLNSNNPESFKRFIESIIINTQNIKNIEILVSIDKNDSQMINAIEKINADDNNLIKYIETDLIKTFADAWKPLNILLDETSKTVKFISCMSDDIRFITKNWDTIIKKYENFYDDKIFRIRCSKFRKEKYNDIWQCGYKPDSYAFYSKEWLKIVGQWNPCIGPDTFQECIAYYLRSYGNIYNREIIDNELNFTGQEVSTNLTFELRIKRTRIYYKAFFILMSYKNQSLANSYAYEIIKAISDKKTLKIQTLSRFKTYYINLYRRLNFFYYRGSPNHFINSKMKNIFFILWCYLSFSDKYIISVMNFLNRKKYLDIIIKNKKKLQQIKKIINHNDPT